MKKIILFVMTLASALSIFVTTALAAAPTVSVSSAEAKPGESVTIAVSITGNTGFFSLSSTVSYDSTVLRLTDLSAGSLTAGALTANKDTGMVSFSGSQNVQGDGTLFTMTFAVIEDASSDDTKVSVTADMYNEDMESLDPSITDGVVTIQAPPHEHTWGDWEVTMAATCAVEGVETRTCSGCDETDTRAIPKTEHTWGDWTVTTAATCTEKGTETRSCSVCGATQTRDIEALDHRWDTATVTTPATCTTAGVRTITCSICGESITETIPFIGHDWGEWKTTKVATFTEEGTRTRTCAACGETETEKIPAIGYKFLEGADQTWTKGGKQDLAFKVNGELAAFDHAEIDGSALAKESYTTAAGSTVLTLKADYLETLSVGSHTLTAVYADGGKASATFTVKEKAETTQAAAAAQSGGTDQPKDTAKKSPQTGDDASVALWIGMLLLCGGAAVVIGRRKYE